MSAGGFEDYLPTIGPGWLRGPWGAKLSSSIGKIMDDQNERMRSAVKASQPDGALALEMSDALDRQGDDRGLPRGGTAPNVFDESDASYAARLKAAWETYAQDDAAGGGAGSVKGLLLQLGIAGFPLGANGAHVINHIGLSWWMNGTTLTFDNMGVCVNRVDLAGTRGGLIGFTRDWQDQFFSRFVILFPVNVPELGNTDTPAKARLNSIVKNWKSAPAIYDGAIIVATGGRVWGYPSTYVWNNGDTWGQFDSYVRYVDPE
jgi:hypothetical protein